MKHKTSSISGKELFNSLPKSTRDMISKSKYSKEDWAEWTKKMREKSRKRLFIRYKLSHFWRKKINNSCLEI